MGKRGFSDQKEKPRSVTGDAWEMRGVEIGGYRGDPPALFDLKFKKNSPMPQLPFGFEFHTYFQPFDYTTIENGGANLRLQPK